MVFCNKVFFFLLLLLLDIQSVDTYNVAVYHFMSVSIDMNGKKGEKGN